MCLAVPGKIVEISHDAMAVGPRGVIDYQGSRFEASLAFTPDAQIGDWVLVHAGFSISTVEEAEAREIWDLFAQSGGVGFDGPPLDEPLLREGVS